MHSDGGGRHPKTEEINHLRVLPEGRVFPKQEKDQINDVENGYIRIKNKPLS